MTTTTTEAVLMVDYENNGETWWNAARELADSMRNPTWTRLFNLFDSSDVVDVCQTDAEQFLATARTLEGWDDGPQYARNPVLVQW